jgi:hypothetical protein
MGTGDPFPGGKGRPRRDADHSPHLLQRSWMSSSYTSSPYYSIGVLWDCFTFYIRLGIPCEFFPSGILTKIAFTSAVHVTHMSCIYSAACNYADSVRWRVWIMKLLHNFHRLHYPSVCWNARILFATKFPLCPCRCPVDWFTQWIVAGYYVCI